MSRSWEGGSTTAWRKTRTLILARDRHVCRLRLPGCTHQATCVHHTIGRAVSGDDPAHLVAACQPCNLKAGQPAGDPQPRTVTRW